MHLTLTKNTLQANENLRKNICLLPITWSLHFVDAV